MTDTSQAALEALEASGNADAQLEQVAYRLSQGGGLEGYTADELRVLMLPDWPHIHNAIMSARLSKLVNEGRAVKTAMRRPSEAGRMQAVYIHADYADPADIKRMGQPVEKDRFLQQVDPILRAMKSRLDAGAEASVSPNGPFHNLLKDRYK